MLIQKLITTNNELEQVALLSAANVAANIADEQKKTEGYVTWSYPLDTLCTLNEISPSVIVKDADMVVGYALALTREMAPHFTPLKEAMQWFGSLQHNGRSLLDYRVYFLGQTCIHHNYRGKGILELLYDFHRQQFAQTYDFALSEISINNPRSKRAHEKLGFTTLTSRFIDAEKWETVMWRFS